VLALADEIRERVQEGIHAGLVEREGAFI
jgi:hypothetical protein